MNTKQTGVPYLLFDGGFTQIARSYAAAGEALGTGERARKLAHYTERLLADIHKRLAGVPAEKRPLVYYARGPRGMQTGLKGSINVESIERRRAQCRGRAYRLGGSRRRVPRAAADLKSRDRRYHRTGFCCRD